jgi:rSAM/selenodomain-associated transferase 1
MSVDSVAICVFAKPPRAGRSKTRLTPAVGADGAAALAKAFLTDTLALICATPWATPVLATTRDSLKSPFDPSIWPSGCAPELWIQPETSLDDRIEQILMRALQSHDAAFALGADSPGLPPQRLHAARRALLTHDAVLGPSDDGGFYLLGLRRCVSGLLAGVPWSVSETAERTHQALLARGFTVAMIEPWWDVDEPEDLPRLAELSVDQAPATTAVIADLGLDLRAAADGYQLLETP